MANCLADNSRDGVLHVYTRGAFDPTPRAREMLREFAGFPQSKL